MMEIADFYVPLDCPVKAQNAGLFVSRGNAMHPTRIIDSHELIFVKQGELDMWEEDRTFHLEAGDTLHLLPGRQHGSTKLMPPDLKFYWIHFELESQIENDVLNTGDDYMPPLRIPQVKHMRIPDKLERLFRMFLEDQETGTLHPNSANLLTAMMLSEISHSHDDNLADPDETNVPAIEAHTYIRINYDRGLSAQSVAEAVGYNVDYLGRLYRMTYGCTVTEAIHRRQIEVACQLLIDSNLLVMQIARRCGFSDPDYFRRIFRRYIRITPGDYRRANSHIHVNTH